MGETVGLTVQLMRRRGHQTRLPRLDQTGLHLKSDLNAREVEGTPNSFKTMMGAPQ